MKSNNQNKEELNTISCKLPSEEYKNFIRTADELKLSNSELLRNIIAFTLQKDEQVNNPITSFFTSCNILNEEVNKLVKRVKNM